MSFGDTLIQEDGFGFVARLPGTELEKSREIVRRYTLTNKHKAIVRLISWGASIQSIKVPNRDGKLADVVLGFDNMDGYLKNRYMGSIIDRVANCISGGTMHLDNVIYPLSINDRAGKDRFNGGTVAFDNTNWQSQIVNNRVVMSHLSQRYSQGYPSDVLTQIKYTWTDDNQLHINIRATSTSSTPVNITNYCLFNLAGHGTGSKELKKHILTVNADSWIFMDVKNNLPSVICPVDGTACELRLPAQLNQRRLYDIPGSGYNHNLCVNSPSSWCYRFHARILHPTSGRFLEVYSNNPGLQVYTGNELPHQHIYPPDLEDREWGNRKNVQINSWKSTKEIAKEKATEVYGKGGVPYRRHGGFVLSPQNYPNADNIEHFPSCMLHPGKMYTHDMTYKFGVLFED
ncbi:PREDICTED: aldose 1-epimerase-like [Trachymyrmex cornetzi]|uniref:Galactose mutarotase n=1 Tax=Trachymyrmex cornetzi TaxID=471704 RepID=A0A195DSK1_9HYME|nr:PREDICTED: aldose 1-epimerase-like [Trachymyrmex cornetzi]KYN15828.1 Aldose 1-epimerase [Trachymyrmex cornetzi]